jgi:hypothetical protein
MDIYFFSTFSNQTYQMDIYQMDIYFFFIFFFFGKLRVYRCCYCFREEKYNCSLKLCIIIIIIINYYLLLLLY